jgi:hypothetical protein
MSLTAGTLINAALRQIGAYAPGETPTADDTGSGLEALIMMVQSWSAKNIRIYFTEQDTYTIGAVVPITIGSGGMMNTVRPNSIQGAFVRDSNAVDHALKIVGGDTYRKMSLKSFGSSPEILYYNPEYPLGLIYIWPTGGGTLYLDSLKPLIDPTALVSTISFPPEYNEAIKWGLAVRLCPEFGKQLTPELATMASQSLDFLETKNFAAQVNEARPEIIRAVGRYNIECD